MTSRSYEKRLLEATASLQTRLIGRTVLFAPSLPSTNETVLDSGPTLEEGTVVIADEQSAGRGRQGRRWYSPAGANIYLSIGLRQETLGENTPLLPLAMAAAMIEAVEAETKIGLSLKWPNDLLWQERKVGGILCEARRGLLAAGIGLNVNLGAHDFPKNLQGEAASIAMAVGGSVAREALVVRFLAAFEAHHDRLVGGDLEPLLTEIRNRSTTLGRQVVVSVGAAEIRGKAVKISDRGDLVVAREDGSQVALSTGDVSHLR